MSQNYCQFSLRSDKITGIAIFENLNIGIALTMFYHIHNLVENMNFYELMH